MFEFALDRHQVTNARFIVKTRKHYCVTNGGCRQLLLKLDYFLTASLTHVWYILIEKVFKRYAFITLAIFWVGATELVGAVGSSRSIMFRQVHALFSETLYK